MYPKSAWQRHKNQNFCRSSNNLTSPWGPPLETKKHKLTHPSITLFNLRSACAFLLSGPRSHVHFPRSSFGNLKALAISYPFAFLPIFSPSPIVKSETAAVNGKNYKVDGEEKKMNHNCDSSWTLWDSRTAPGRAEPWWAW